MTEPSPPLPPLPLTDEQWRQLLLVLARLCTAQERIAAASETVAEVLLAKTPSVAYRRLDERQTPGA
jgi:hypothetical protein